MSPKTKKFDDLVAPLKADPERRAQIEEGTREILTAVRLVELRRERGLTQVQLAERLGMTQENVSRIERAEDTQLSTIRRYIEALGGSLELHAVFEDRDVPIAAAQDRRATLLVASVGRVRYLCRPLRILNFVRFAFGRHRRR